MHAGAIRHALNLCDVLEQPSTDMKIASEESGKYVAGLLLFEKKMKN